MTGKDVELSTVIFRCFGRASIAALEDYISWSVRTNASERYKVTACYTGMEQSIGNVYAVEIAGQSLEGTVETTGKHLVIELGEVTVPMGRHTLTVKAKQQQPGSNLVNLTDISFMSVR